MSHSNNDIIVPDFMLLQDGCQLIAQAVAAGMIPPLSDGRYKARQEELTQAYDVWLDTNPPYVGTMYIDACNALIYAYNQHSPLSSRLGAYTNASSEDFDVTTVRGWLKRHFMEAYLEEAFLGQIHYNPDKLAEDYPPNLTDNGKSIFSAEKMAEIETVTALIRRERTQSGMMLETQPDDRMKEAQRLVDERLDWLPLPKEPAPQPAPYIDSIFQDETEPIVNNN